MPLTFLNPAKLHDPTLMSYSHTVSVSGGSGLVFVSGQYASDKQGGVVSTEFAAQVEVAFNNLQSCLAAHRLDLDSVAQLRTYIVNHDVEKAAALGQAVQARWGAQLPAHTLVGVASLAMPDILFEVEAVAIRSA